MCVKFKVISLYVNVTAGKSLYCVSPQRRPCIARLIPKILYYFIFLPQIFILAKLVSVEKL